MSSARWWKRYSLKCQGRNNKLLYQVDEFKILGIDPGSINCGYGLIKTSFPFVRDSSTPVYIASGRIILPKKTPLYLRLKTLYDILLEIISEYRPSEMVVESMFFAKSVKAALNLGQARGIVLLAAASEGLSVYEYSSLEVKKAVTGYGKAEKRQVKDMVTRILNLNRIPYSVVHNPYYGARTTEYGILSDDSADALALALCHLNNISFKEKLKS
jgi:crossover junction endodeoxyribonuclease RuvC